VAPATPPAAPTALEPPRPPALGLGQQVAALDRARDALASGNAAGALRLVDEYDRQFPRGALAQEATALRIEALVQQGNRDAAGRLAERFLDANPRSPHAARIRLLVQRATNP
jgi:TolA-binding protein